MDIPSKPARAMHAVTNRDDLILSELILELGTHHTQPHNLCTWEFLPACTGTSHGHGCAHDSRRGVLTDEFPILEPPLLLYKYLSNDQ
jgi:hypothetical protein